MSRSDQQLVIILIVTILVYIGIWVTGLVRGKVFNTILWLNAVTSLAFLVYRLQHELRIVQHTAELREIVVLGLEGLVLIFSCYCIISTKGGTGWKIFHYTAYGVHLTALVLLLIFMISFKFNRLI